MSLPSGFLRFKVEFDIIYWESFPVVVYSSILWDMYWCKMYYRLYITDILFFTIINLCLWIFLLSLLNVSWNYSLRYFVLVVFRDSKYWSTLFKTHERLWRLETLSGIVFYWCVETSEIIGLLYTKPRWEWVSSFKEKWR